MQFGAASPRRQQIDLNVIPREFRRRQFPVLTAGLSLLLVGCLLLLYGVFYLKSYADLEIGAFRARIVPAQEAVRSATADEATANQVAQRYASQRSDYRVLAERQVRWSGVLQAVSSPPPGITVKEISQAGYTVSVLGSAPEFALAVKFLEDLRATNLFSNSSIELIDSSLLAGSPTPRASYGTPTPTRPAGAVVPYLTPGAPGATAAVTRTVTGTPTPTRTPNTAATATTQAQLTANAKAQQTAAAASVKAGQTATARAKQTATALAKPSATATKPPTATPITTMVLPIAANEATEVGATTSTIDHGPALAVDGNASTAWVPEPLAGSSGRWLRIDLRNSVWYTPGTDLVWSVKILPYRLLKSGSLPATSPAQYFVYTYDTSGARTQRCFKQSANWAQTQADTCWSATANANVPLRNVAVIDVGIPSSNPSTDANWFQGIAEVVIEVNQRPPSVAVVGSSGPVGLGAVEAPGTATITATPTRIGTPPPIGTASPTSAVNPLVGTPTPPRFAIPTPPPPTPSALAIPTNGPIPPPIGQSSADFLILLEVRPGEGYK